MNGSAPRVRGTGILNVRWMAALRFSPACAGNSCPRRGDVTRVAVQPRVCGEQPFIDIMAARAAGSAPRVRGTGRAGGAAPGARRFSPACAGNSFGKLLPPWASAVQPRVCGEQDPVIRFDAPQNGSAPRVRGTGSRGVPRFRKRRFSPACAGNRLPTNYWITKIFTMSKSAPKNRRPIPPPESAMPRLRRV